jgi:hypothetical protein
MNKIIAALFLLGASIQMHSQARTQIEMTDKVDLDWGSVMKIDKKSRFQDVLAHDKTGSYILKSGRKGKSIEKLNNKMMVERSLALPLSYQKKEMDLEGLVYYNDKIVMLSSFNNRKLKKNFLFYQIINTSNLTVEGSIKNVGEIAYENRRFQGVFGFDVAADSSKMLLFFEMPYEKKTPRKYNFKVLDSKLDEIWDQEVELPYKEHFFTVSDYEVSSKGDVFVLGYEFDADKKTKAMKSSPNYKYHVIGYYDKGKKIVDYEVNLHDKFIKNVTFDINSSGDIICSGFYSESYGSGIKGAFFLSIDGASRKVMKESYKEFDESFITAGWSDREVNKAKKKKIKKDKAIEMYDYDLKDFVLRADGGVVLLAEQFYIRVVTTTSTDANGNTTTKTTYHYYYNDVIVINISPEGNIEWTTKVEKYQHSKNDDGRLSSFALQVRGDMMYLVYNERAKQYFDKEERSGMKGKDKRSYLTLLVTLNADGEYEKEILLNNSVDKVYTVPKLCEQISESEMLIYSTSRKAQKFGKMKIK